MTRNTWKRKNQHGIIYFCKTCSKVVMGPKEETDANCAVCGEKMQASGTYETPKEEHDNNAPNNKPNG